MPKATKAGEAAAVSAALDRATAEPEPLRHLVARVDALVFDALDLARTAHFQASAARKAGDTNTHCAVHRIAVLADDVAVQLRNAISPATTGAWRSLTR